MNEAKLCCVGGAVHEGDPKGRIEVVGGVETYVSEPPQKKEKYKKIILFYSDIHSSLHINNKLVQDYFASHGFLVLGPDYFEGKPLHPYLSDPGFISSTYLADAVKRADFLMPKWLESVKAKFGVEDTKYTAVGYCFGAPYVMEQGANGIISAGALVHPTFLNEDRFRKIKAPLLLSCAEIDPLFPVESRRRAEDILVEDKKLYHIQVFSGVAHGFAVRGDPNVENERWAKEESARGVLSWFERFSK